MNTNYLAVAPPQSEAELQDRARRIAGLSLAQFAQIYAESPPVDLKNAKGWMGQLLEKHLGATAASLAEPDFQSIGVELKTIPINRDGLPRESTYVCTVPLQDNSGLQWENSWVRRKLSRVLWVPIEADPTIPLSQRRIGSAMLWSPTSQQAQILQHDWEELMELVCLGRLGELSARLGRYLQIRPKAANAGALCTATNEDGEPTLTLPRGFYLRASFTSEILKNSYICPED